MVDLLEYIKQYRKLGIVTIPVVYGEKKPEINWKEYQTQAPTKEEYEKWFDDGKDYNVAGICGPISKNLAVLDFDKESLVEEFFLKERHTYRNNVC